MSGGTGQSLRTPAARALMLAAFTITLVLGSAFIAINTAGDGGLDARAQGAPLTDDESKHQVVDSAQQIVTAAQLRDVTGSYIFLSCANEHDPPYQAAVYLNFRLPEANPIERFGEIAAAMGAVGWREAPVPGEHFGKTLTKDGVTSTFHQNLDKAGFGVMRVYGECRNTADHRNDDPAWVDITDQLS